MKKIHGPSLDKGESSVSIVGIGSGVAVPVIDCVALDIGVFVIVDIFGCSKSSVSEGENVGSKVEVDPIEVVHENNPKSITLSISIMGLSKRMLFMRSCQI
jgi:hypothetical protein